MESFGARLKREREQRKVTLDEISLSTKIGTHFLRALEEERFEQLPGGIFNKGFVRAYARHLGMDEEQAISEYLAASGTAPADNKLETVPELHVRSQEDSQAAARIPWGILAAALLLVAFALAIWGFHSRERPESPPSIAPASAPKPTTSETAAQSATSVGASTAEPHAGSNTLAAPRVFVVLIKARETSWLAITVDGMQIMNETLVAPGEKSVEGQKEVVIRAGDVGALDFFFNGKKISVQGDYGQAETLVFDANGLQSTAAKPEPQ